MPASPSQALRGRARRLAAGAGASAAAVLLLCPGARAELRPAGVTAGAPAEWDGAVAVAKVALFDPATLAPCGGTFADVCDDTLVHVAPDAGPGTLSVTLTGTGADAPDVDLYVYRADPLGAPQGLAGASTGPGADERVDVAEATGDYLVRAASFSLAATAGSGYHGHASFTARPATPPDVATPGGLEPVAVSPLDGSTGPAEQPAVAASARHPRRLVAAWREFTSDGRYTSRIATAISHNAGRRWHPLGLAGDGFAGNPSLAYGPGDTALLLTNDQPADAPWRVSVRRLGPARDGTGDDGEWTWSAPVTVDAAPAGATDDRPVLAASAAGVVACWIRNFDAGGPGRQVVICRRSDDGRTWEPERALSPERDARMPVGPYVAGLAVAADPAVRDGFVAAWVDTLSGRLDGTGLAPVLVARMADAPDGSASWSSPVRAGSIRPLPHTFPGDTFRNVPLLSLAPASDGHLWIAAASEEPAVQRAGTQADVRLLRSEDGGATWLDPITVGTDRSDADQFQPSLAVTAQQQLVVSFLDRRLDPSNTFADEWLARSDDAGTTWREQRLSPRMWDPEAGAPHSPSGDLLGDHQALVADDCSAVALAADPHVAAAGPQLFAWPVENRVDGDRGRGCRGGR